MAAKSKKANSKEETQIMYDLAYGDKHIDEYADKNTERGQCMLKTICQKLGFSSLGYQSLDGLLEAIGIDENEICTYCWSGKE